MPKLPTGPGKKVLEQVRQAQQNHLAPDTIYSPQQQYLTFRLDLEWYALSVYQLVEILPPPRITRVPSVPDHILGVMNIRGEVLSAIDLKRFFGLPQSELTTDQAIIVVQHGELRTGLLVDEIGDLISLAPEVFSEDPIMTDQSQRVFFEGATYWGEVLLSIIRLAGIFQSEGMYSHRG